MQHRTLGRQGLVVSAMGLGCMGMSEFYGVANTAEAIATLLAACEEGITLFDTADMYGPFTNEVLLGEVLGRRRGRVVIATKFGYQRTATGGWLGISGRPEYVRACCEDSLRRLATDHIDLYYQHRVDPSVPIEDTVGAMSRLVEAGCVRYLGLSEAGAETIRRGHAVHPITAVQTEYSLWSREVEAEILPTCRELGIGLVAYSPLGRGFLTSRIRLLDDLAPNDFRREVPRFAPMAMSANLVLMEGVTAIAAQMGVSPAQLALAWVLAKGGDIVPIPGTTKRSHLFENLGALGLALSGEECQSLEACIPPQAVYGERYPARSMRLVGL